MNLEFLFCEKCLRSSPANLPTNIVGRLGCDSCRINNPALLSKSRKLRTWNTCLLTSAQSIINGELLLYAAFNNGVGVTRWGRTLQEPFWLNIRISTTVPLNQQAEEYMNVLDHNVELWKAPILQSIDVSCLLLATMCRLSKTTVVVSKNILLMLGDGISFINLDVCGMFDTIVYAQLTEEVEGNDDERLIKV